MPAVPNITIRLDEDSFALLLDEMNRYGDASRHKAAKRLLLDALRFGEIMANVEETGIAVKDQRELLERIPRLIKKSVYAVLVYAAKTSDDDANKWIQKYMADDI